MRRAAAALAIVLLAGCGGKQKTGGTGGSTQEMGMSGGIAGAGDLQIPKVDGSLCDTKDKEVVQFDLNQDGKPDSWKLLKKTEEKGATVQTLTCKQVDLDHDGRKDNVVHYDESGAMLVEDFDFDFDGRFDARYHYDRKTGVRYLVERETGFDGKPDLWEKYDQGDVIVDLRRDRNADGKPDYWEQYTAGSLERILYDDDFDGKVDRQEQAIKQAAPAGEAAPVPAAEPTPAAASPGSAG